MSRTWHERRKAERAARRATPLQRLMDKVVKNDNECWIWTSRVDRGDYGYFHYEKKGRRAHRVAYELLVGPIPDGLELDHICNVRRCVNPDHLEPVTHAENHRRRVERKYP